MTPERLAEIERHRELDGCVGYSESAELITEVKRLEAKANELLQEIRWRAELENQLETDRTKEMGQRDVLVVALETLLDAIPTCDQEIGDTQDPCECSEIATVWGRYRGTAGLTLSPRCERHNDTDCDEPITHDAADAIREALRALKEVRGG